MKKYIMILLSTLVLSFSQCTIEKEVLQEGKSYIRFINLLPAPSTPISPGTVRFYFDDVINVNGDTAVYDFKNDLFARITTDYNTSGYREIDSRTGSTTNNIDLKGQGTSGVYSFGTGAGGNEKSFIRSYFPNVTHRIALAPVVNGVNYYKWAQIPAGSHVISFKPSFKRTSPVYNDDGDEIIDENILELKVFSEIYRESFLFNQNQFQTLLLTNVRQSSADIPRPAVIAINEKVDQYNFKDSSTYIRFINFTVPGQLDENLNASTREVDVYFVKTKEGDVESEVLVQSNLKRFDISNQSMDFFEIDMKDLLEDLAKDTTLISKYNYKFRFYRKGDSKALDRLPLTEVKAGLYTTKKISVNGREPDGIFLLAEDPRGYQTVIQTVIFNIVTTIDVTQFQEFHTNLITYHFERNISNDIYLD